MKKAKETSTLKKQTISGFLWMLSGSGIQSIMQFIVLIVLSRLLDPKSFGIANAALVVISFTVILSTLGLGPALVQKKEIDDKHIATSYTGSLFLAIFFGIIIFIISPSIANFFSIDELNIVLKTMSIVFLLQGVSIVSESLIQRNLLFNLMVKIQVISYLFYAIIGVVLGIMGAGFWALVAAFLVQHLVKSVLSMYLQPYKIRFGFDYKAFRELLYFSGGYSIAKLSSEVSLKGDNFIIGKYLGADALGLYSRAYQLMVTPANLIGQILERVLFPVMSKLQDNKERVSYVFSEGIRLTTTLILPASIFLMIHAENIILLLFGEQWLDLKLPFQVLAGSLLFRSSYKISDSLAKSLGAVYYRALIKWIYAGIVLTFAYIGHFYGLVGVSVGVAIAIIVNYILMTLLAIRLTKIKLEKLFHAHIGGFILSFVFALSTIIVHQVLGQYIEHFILNLILFTCLFIIIFIACVLISPNLFIGEEGEKYLNKFKVKIKK